MSLYTYRVREVTQVIDGDTVAIVADLGFGLRANLRVRLAGVDTPERGDPDWYAAKDTTTRWLTQNMDGLIVQTQKAGPSTSGIGDGAFGRWLGEFESPGDDNHPHSLNALLITKGWASTP